MRKLLLFLVLLCWTMATALAQDPNVDPAQQGMSKQERKELMRMRKELAKDREIAEKERKKREETEFKQAQKRHEAIQSDDTRQRMKQRKKNAGKNFNHKKPSLWKRLFGPRRST